MHKGVIGVAIPNTVKVRGWLEGTGRNFSIMCISSQCTVGDKPCPNVKFCKEFEITLKPIAPNEQEG
jgi:hypothetical protein